MHSFADTRFLVGKTMLVISPHPDDETYGCAGLIARALAAGARVAVLVISAPESLRQFNDTAGVVTGRTRVAEFEAAMDCLGVREHAVVWQSNAVHMRLDAMPQMDLVGLIERDSTLSLEALRPDIVCLPAASYNQDHDAVWRAGVAACRPHLPSRKAFAPMVLVYEQPQLAWGRPAFTPNVYFDISEVLARKLDACRCYQSQLHPEPHHGSVENVERLARWRGSEVATWAAEAYQCLRFVI